MSKTNQNVIDQALIEIGVVQAGDSANATDSADALTKLNQMMAAWEISDKKLGFFPQDTLSDTCPIPIWAEDAVVNNLAILLAPSFEIPPSADTYRKASDGINLVGRVCINENLEGADMSHLGSTRIFNITQGY